MSDNEMLPTWSRTFEVGLERIDCEHKMILSALTDFLITVENDLGQRLAIRVLRVLYNYTKSHFENEEQIMRDIEYELLDEHHWWHGEFLERLEGVRDRFQSGENVCESLIGLFRNFLHQHILVDDAKIGEFARGLPQAISAFGRLPCPSEDGPGHPGRADIDR